MGLDGELWSKFPQTNDLLNVLWSGRPEANRPDTTVHILQSWMSRNDGVLSNLTVENEQTPKYTKQS